MTYDPSGQQPNDPYNPYPDAPKSGEPYTQYPDSAPPQQPTSGGSYPQQPGYDAYQQPGYQQPGYQQPGYQQPGYQQPGYQASGYQTPVNPGFMPGQELPQGMAVTSMVLGIVSIPMLFCCYIGVITGIAAIVFGAIGTNQAKKGEARGQGMAMAGLICGAVAVVLFIVLIVLYLALGFSGAYDFDSNYSSY